VHIRMRTCALNYFLGQDSPNISTILLRFFLLQFFPKPIRMHQTRKNYGRIVETFCRRARRGKIVEELWKNCRKILWALERQRRGEIFWKNRPGAKSFYNSSTILPQFFPAALPDEGPQNLSTIFSQF
jgi:hypothetical protein